MQAVKCSYVRLTRKLGLVITLLLTQVYQGGTLRSQWLINEAAIMLLQKPAYAPVQKQNAVYLLRAALEFDSSSASAIRLLLGQAIRDKQIVAARVYIEKGHRLGQSLCDESIALGLLYWDSKEPSDAISVWETGIVQYHCSLVTLARVLGTMNLSDLDSHSAALIKSMGDRIGEAQSLSASDYVAWGRLLFLGMNRIDWAKSWFQQAEAVSPNDAGILWHLYNLEVGLGNYDTALTYLERLQRAAGYTYWVGEAEIHLARGGLLQRQPSRSREATLEFEKAVSLAPNNAYARLRLGVAYETDGRCSEALIQYKIIFDLPKQERINMDEVKQRYNQLSCSPGKQLEQCPCSSR
jgi:tetratricopeptide (TPR) repeat protein